MLRTSAAWLSPSSPPAWFFLPVALLTHRAPSSPFRRRHPSKFQPSPCEIAGAAAPQQMMKSFFFLFSKEAYLPFHLMVMSHFKERTRLGQHCPVSISSQFKGRAWIPAFHVQPLSNTSFNAVYVLFLSTCVSASLPKTIAAAYHNLFLFSASVCVLKKK